jgi:hypothetical protein
VFGLAAPTSVIGYANGTYFVSEWAPVALILIPLVLLASVAGVHGTQSR